MLIELRSLRVLKEQRTLKVLIELRSLRVLKERRTLKVLIELRSLRVLRVAYIEGADLFGER